MTTLVIGLLLVSASPAAAGHHHHRHGCRPHGTAPRYAHCLTLHRWHSSAEWRALNALVRNESGWDPCAVNPGLHDCSYLGSSACGIPQADPCSKTWWGRQGDLYGTRYVQVRWMLWYIESGYGDPINAYYHETHGGY